MATSITTVKGELGYSGYSGISGSRGISGYSGILGYSGISGYSGMRGISGYSQDHAQLSNLDYDHSEHTYFQKELIWEPAYGTYIIENS